MRDPDPFRGGEAEQASFVWARKRMLAEQIMARGVCDPLTLGALGKVPRQGFVAARQAVEAYEDCPLSIGHEQTISQPYIVAFMTEALGLRPGHSVLEVGTGSGYQAAVLASIVARVYTLEIVDALAAEARERLLRLGYLNVEARAGDGYLGWPEAAPFDAIIVAAAAPRVPELLRAQLKDGARLVVPIGAERAAQELLVVTRRGQHFEERRVLPVRFVPMTGAIRDRTVP